MIHSLVLRIPPGVRIVLLALPLCFVLGTLIGMGWYYPVAFLLAPIFVIAVLSRPRLSVWVTLVGALVIAGLTQLYLPQYQVVRWLFALLGIAVGGIALVNAIWDKRMRLSVACRRFFLWGAMLFLVAFLANMLESGSVTVAAVGLKNYFQLWGLLLAIIFLGYSAEEAGRFMYFLLGLALIQWPFALHQYFKLVPQRRSDLDAAQGVVPVDIVDGTFGGTLHGGGLSMDSAMLASIAIAIVMALWRAGRMRMSHALMACGFILIPLAINEAKVIVVMLPMALFFVFRDKLLRNPLQFLAGSVAALGVVATLLVGYSMLPSAGSGPKNDSLQTFIDESILGNFGEKGYGRSYLNRTTVYRHWFSENVMHGSWDKVLIGYGPGATNSGSFVSGDASLAARRYKNYNIGLTALSSLLWEVGLLGALATAGFFLVLFRTASRLVQVYRQTLHWPLLVAAQAAIPIIALSLVVTNYYVFDLGLQAIFVTITGYVLCMSNREVSGA